MPLDAVAKSKPEIVHSACPHDCPSTCALEVERLSPTQIGRVHGAKANPYTAGVICAKVARYAERQHHPERLAQPMRRVGDKGVGLAAFKPMAWDEAMRSMKTPVLITPATPTLRPSNIRSRCSGCSVAASWATRASR